MTALSLLALLGIAVLIPAFTSDSDDAEDAPNELVAPETPVTSPDTPPVTDTPLQPEPSDTTVEGTAQADTLRGDTGQAVNAGAGNDTLSSTGNNLGRFGLDTLRGLAGDDVLIHIAADSSGPLVLEGGDGNDTLTANEVEFGNQTTLNGGAGDDVLQTDIFTFSGGPNGSFDTFITGEGADRIEISYLNVSGVESAEVGLLGRVTDFDPEEDVIAVDPRWLIREIEEGESTAFAQLVTLREDPDGAFTDLEFTYTSQATQAQFSGIIRLEGLTGLTEDDIAVVELDADDPAFNRPGIIVGT